MIKESKISRLFFLKQLFLLLITSSAILSNDNEVVNVSFTSVFDTGDKYLTKNDIGIFIRLYYKDDDRLLSIGKEYIDLQTKKQTKNDLLYAIFNKQVMYPSEDSLKNKLKQMITMDYKEGNTLILNKWLLSETEARIAGYFYLSNK